MQHGRPRNNDHGYLIDNNRRIYFTILVIFFEIFKIIFNQSVNVGLINSIFAFCLYSLPFYLIKPIAFIINALEITECIAWFFTKEGVTVQVINSMDITWAYNHHFELIYALIGIIIVNIVIVWIPIPSNFKRKNYAELFLIILIVLTLFFVIKQNIKRSIDPFSQKMVLRNIRDIFDEIQKLNSSIKKNPVSDLMNFLSSPIESNRSENVKKPNLLILEIESLEYSVLGSFSAQNKRMMPYVTSLVTNGHYFRNVISQPYTTWSVASMFSVQCNMPLLLQHVTAGDQGKFHLSPRHKCLGDFLNMAGYKLISYQSNFFIGDFLKQMKMHKWDCYDVYNHSFKRDWDVFKFVSDEVLKNLEKEKKPFVLHIANADCHAIPKYFVDPRCMKRLPGTKAIIRSFDCVDQILENFFKKFEKSKLFDTTEVILYGDHVLMSGNRKKIKFTEPRSLVLSFPYRKKKADNKKVTLYDIAPTIMNMLGIQYSPKFPFGSDLFSKAPSHPPTVNDFEIIYNVFTYEYKWDKNVTCWNGQKGFCTYAKN